MRVKLCEKYKSEREELCNKLIQIVELDPNNSFLLSELDENTQKQQAILATLERFNGSRKDTAEELGISPRTLRYKLAKMKGQGLQVPA